MNEVFPAPVNMYSTPFLSAWIHIDGAGQRKMRVPAAPTLRKTCASGQHSLAVLLRRSRLCDILVKRCSTCVASQLLSEIEVNISGLTEDTFTMMTNVFRHNVTLEPTVSKGDDPWKRKRQAREVEYRFECSGCPSRVPDLNNHTKHRAGCLAGRVAVPRRADGSCPSLPDGNPEGGQCFKLFGKWVISYNGALTSFILFEHTVAQHMAQHAGYRRLTFGRRC
jgi:hypothetical protein